MADMIIGHSEKTLLLPLFRKEPTKILKQEDIVQTKLCFTYHYTKINSIDVVSYLLEYLAKHVLYIL